MKTQPAYHQVDKNLLVKVGDIPAGDVQLGPVAGSGDPVLFPGGPVRDGRLQLIFHDPPAGDTAKVDAAPVDTVISLGVDLKNAAGDVIYSASANGIPSAAIGDVNLPGELVLPTDALELGTAEITVTDGLNLEGLALVWVQDR